MILFARKSRKHEFGKGFELKNSTSLLYLPISSSAETWKMFRNMLGQFFFACADILSEKNPYFGKHLFCKTRADYAYIRYPRLHLGLHSKSRLRDQKQSYVSKEF